MVEESSYVSYTKYIIALMAVLSEAFVVANYSQASKGYVSSLLVIATALALLNECLLPKAIRSANLPQTAHLPQRLMPMPRRLAQIVEIKEEPEEEKLLHNNENQM